jgi:23S rRNA (guanine745-N1)-methyltransferase
VVLESQEDIFNLFTMTPYYYKTSSEAVEKLKKVNRLELTCGFSIRTFTKKRGF